MSKVVHALCLVVALGVGASSAFAQEYTTAQVLAKLDEKAKVFSSLEAPVAHTQVVEGAKHPTKQGKIFIKMVKGVPRFFWDVTDPKERMRILIDKGEVKVYSPTSNSYTSKKVDPNSEMLQLLLIGFGVPSATLTKNYNAAVKASETVNGVQAVVLELTSISPLTARFPKITLWLDPKTWTPMRTRVTEKSKDTTDFDYSNIRLNKDVKDSVFNLKIPGNATKQ